jgi:hypothetical protein
VFPTRVTAGGPARAARQRQGPPSKTHDAHDRKFTLGLHTGSRATFPEPRPRDVTGARGLSVDGGAHGSPSPGHSTRRRAQGRPCIAS